MNTVTYLYVLFLGLLLRSPFDNVWDTGVFGYLAVNYYADLYNLDRFILCLNYLTNIKITAGLTLIL